MTDDPERSGTGDDVAAAMAARDWSATPLGPRSTWPSQLHDVVRILLTSRFAMWAAWGPELTMFYNDAYRHDTLQAKHPWALGRPASEVWAEIWHDIEPRIRQVLDTGVATWDEDLQLFLERSGYPEETYHTFSYSPLGREDGRAEGMLCVVTENTQRVLGERRMATLRDLAAALPSARSEAALLAAVTEQLARNAADLPFALVYLVDEAGTARLGGATGTTPGHPAAPAVLLPGEPDPAWPVQRILEGGPQLVEDLGARFPHLPTGAWQRPPEQAVCVPIAASGQERGPLAGFLVVGLNPHRQWDDAYRGFVELVAAQIGSGLVNAGTYEAERRRAEALAELDRAKTDFFSNVSHEFRTPLTLIMGPVAELRSEPSLQGSPRVRDELEVIERNALRLGKLVNTLLDFSRLQAGRIDARFEPVDLAATTTELASVFRSAVDRAGLEFTVDCPPLGEPVHIDRDMWEKVVLNLLSNALKFTFTGGITVRLQRTAAGACLTVADTGTGVPADELPRLFERFHRVANARSRSGEGSGIGLAMVRELVTLHGGEIEAHSRPGAGTTFTVTLPFGTAHLPADRLAPPTPDAPAVSSGAVPFVTEALRWLPGPTGERAAEAGDGPAGAEGPAAAGRVLVADDNADMREYLVRLLAPHYSVVAVPDGRAALDAALADPPDLVVSDVMMPGLDGTQLLAALRADERTSRLPVVLLSARAGQQAAVDGLAAGADDYLVKPFSAQELLARVGAHLHLGRARRTAEERFTAMADLAPALIWVSDAAGRRVFVNRGWTVFTGRAAEAELGAGWADLVHPDDRARYRATVEGATAGGEGWEVEFRLRRRDGAHHWLLERAVPIGSGAGSSGYVGSCTDINARYRESERQTLLAEVGTALDRETGVSGQLAALARLVVESRLAEVCAVSLVETDGSLRIAGVAGPDPRTEQAMWRLDPSSGLAPEVVATGSSVLVGHLPDAHPATDHPVLSSSAAVRSGLAVPLSVRGRVLAVLSLGRRDDAPPFNDDDRVLAEEMAARAALAVDNAMLLSEERAAAQRLALLQQATAELSAAMTPAEVGTVAAGHLRQLTGADSRVAVYELDASHRALSALTISGGSPDGHRLWTSLPLTAPLAVTRAVADGRALWLEDVEALPDDRDLPAEIAASLRDYGLGANVALPLTVAGRTVGVIGLAYPAPQTFSPVDRAMLLAVAEQCAQALDRARLYRAEQGIAETLQRSLLPARLPALERLALAAHYLPGAEGTQAGGDWYDVVQLGTDRVAIAVGDVVGQGPAAAAVMGQLRSALSTALLDGHGPAAALELLDRFAVRLPGALASTATCLVLDAAAGTVTWSRAGHPPPLLVGPGGTARFLEGAGAGAVLGAPGRPGYSEASSPIHPGTTLLLYTDGLVERRDEVLDEGLARVRAAAAGHATADPVRLTARLLADVLADADQPDDVALIAARLLPPPLVGRLPADASRLAGVRREVAAWATASGLTEEVASDLQLALGEALANSVEHAYAYGAAGSGGPEECEYRVARSADGDVHVEVVDAGTWRPPPSDRGFRGRGLELISALAHDVEVVHPDDSGTCVRFRFPAGAGAEDAPAPAPQDAPGAFGSAGNGPARLLEHEEGGPLRLSVIGELDLATAAALRDRLLRRLADLSGGTVVVDLTPATYLASAGVGLLLEARAAAADRGIELRVRTAAGSAPHRILALAGLADELGERTAPRSGG